MIGRDEQARPVPIALADSAHLIVQGSSGSGKSTGMYGLLGQLAPAQDVLVVGSDITGKLLEPWATRPGMAEWHALGTRDLGAHVRVLGRWVREVDKRIEQMPPGHDSVPITTDMPLILVVIEEFPGLARLLARLLAISSKEFRRHDAIGPRQKSPWPIITYCVYPRRIPVIH